MMHFERLNRMVYVPGEEDKYKKKLGTNALAPKRITKHDMVTWINKAAIDDETKAELIKSLNRYPANTMHHFYNNLHQHINKIHAERERREREKKRRHQQNDSITENTDE